MKRTNIEINEDLAHKGMEIAGLSTYKDIVNLALSEFVKRNNRSRLQDYFGANIWSGDLE
jgi:Arc/MetJ family transcription regulator